jgi:hypothetical protein
MLLRVWGRLDHGRIAALAHKIAGPIRFCENLRESGKSRHALSVTTKGRSWTILLQKSVEDCREQ